MASEKIAPLQPQHPLPGRHLSVVPAIQEVTIDEVVPTPDILSRGYALHSVIMNTALDDERAGAILRALSPDARTALKTFVDRQVELASPVPRPHSYAVQYDTPPTVKERREAGYAY